MPNTPEGPAFERVNLHIATGSRSGLYHEEFENGLLSAWGVLPCSLTRARGPLIGRNRDEGVRYALADESVTHVLFVDSDTAWHVDDVVKLVMLGLPFTFGRYAFKDGSGRPVASGLVSEHDSPSLGEGVRVQRWRECGGGFVLVTRAALVAMTRRFPHLSYEHGGKRYAGLWWGTGRDAEGKMVGEDYLFCRRWRECDGQIWTRTDVRLGHVGSKVYRLAPENETAADPE